MLNLLTAALLLSGSGGDLKLRYEQPASAWTEAMPLGNGRLGAMVFGNPERERIQFNEDTLWTGKPHDYAHEGAAEALPEIRKLLFEGKQKDAEKLAMKHFMSVPLRQLAYQPCGDLELHFPDHKTIEDYHRGLDLDKAVATVRYRTGGTTFTREVFASAVDQSIVVRLSADGPGMLDFTAALTSPHPSQSRTLETDRITLAGGVGRGVLKFEVRLEAEAEEGTVTASDGMISVSGARAATLKLVAATSFKNYRDVSADPAERCAADLKRSKGKSYAELKRDHVADHRRLFRRMELDLGTTEASGRPTDERIREFGNRKDPALAILFFQFGRYLLIASSRLGSQPANLQGLWNDHLKPSWDSKYTVNINTEMNYWPTELTNLSECHEPLFDLLEDISVTGGRVAKVHYNARGWVLHHNTDLWRGAAPINNSNHGIWPTGGAWLCHHLWEHYLFHEDKDFLRQRAYPLMKGAALFFVDVLVEHPETKELISTPSNSPEQGGLVAGPAMDHQIIRSLFDACIRASEILGVDEEFRATLVEKRKRIASDRIGQHGQLQEWLEDKDNPKNKHRHISHLWALHPGAQITRLGTPKLFAAARKSLEFRGDGGTGWSMAWKINFWARLQNGDHAWLMLGNLLKPAKGRGGGAYPNLFDAHPPFQIDGNFGATAGIAEMLLQSHAGEIHLLPALPSALPDGRIRGLRARGRLEIDLSWKKGRLVEAICHAERDGTYRVRLGDETLDLKTQAGKSHRVTPEDFGGN